MTPTPIVVIVGAGRQKKRLEVVTTHGRVVEAANAFRSDGVLEIEWNRILSELTGGNSNAQNARILYETFISDVVRDALS